jgi:hypothetical protein
VTHPGGYARSLHAAGCPRKRNSVSMESLGGSSSGSAQVSITVRRRKTRFFGFAVRERVFVDGLRVGTLGRGEERTFPVAEGEHVVIVVAGPNWLPTKPRSEPLRVRVPPSVRLETRGYMMNLEQGAIELYDTAAPPPPEAHG